MRILLAEDEAHIGEYLVKGLRENGLVVDWVRNGPDALHQGTTVDYDLVILDIGLPGMDGWEVMRRLRETQMMPVLFLTARDMVEDRVRGLELGADDYLIKPFSFSELLARVRVILRRGKQKDMNVLTIRDLKLDVMRRRVERNGQRIDLTIKEFALLTLFLRRQTEVLSRTLIAELVWEMHFDRDTNVVEVAVRRLRAKVDDPFEHPYIHTVRGFGYVLERRE
ncbi:response regulator [Chitinimonas arctica]|uniref:Response regulator n=1 Tax=Chitinimonas arctica TaxID=2594795 RepID=A0A516SFV3_9NEIS|nr:heavy metal response regulator transcription factor [Chitinimonas arctica]QDQ27047.1 response regulator [Chitinimonas arctica]